jgi:hypothetical protein
MAAGSVSSTSTYKEGKSFSFAKTVASKVLDAAYAAKDKKKKISASGHEAPKGLFANELKKQFITNPYKDFTKKINKNIEKKAKFVGLFSDSGEKFINKFKIGKKKPPTKPSTPADSPKSGGGGAGLSGIGSIVLDIEQIANSLSNLTSLFNTNLGLTYKMSGGLADIKNILSEQLSLQQEKISKDEMRASEAALENSQQNSGSISSTSTIRDEGLLGMFGDFKNIINMIKSLPEMFGGLFKSIISKFPGGKALLGKFGKGAAVAGVEGAAQAGGKGLLKGLLGTALKPLRGIFKAIPFGLGGLFDFALNLALGENPGKAAAKAVGSTIGSSLGAMVAGALGLAGGPAAIATGAVGAILGGTIGDWLGGAAYDMFAPKDNKMAGGGVMIGEAGPEMVTPLNSAMGQGMVGGGALDDAYAQPYNAVAGGMLAVTKDFVEGMGPIGSMVSPAIQNDVDKLGRVFDIPTTNTNIEVGGANLRANPLAEKEGRKYMQDLIEGSLKKLAPENKKDKTSSTGGTGGTTPASSDETGGNTPAGTGAAAPSKPPETNAQYAQRQLTETVSGVNPTMVPAANAQGYTTVDQFNVANPNFQPVKYDTGNVAQGYFYDSKGNIYQIKEDGTKRVVSNDKTILKKGVPNGWMNERMNFFQRNLRDGRVTLSHKPTIGAYDYASNGVYTRKQRLSVWADESNPGAASNIENYAQITPVSKYDPTGTKFNASQPYGPVPQSSMGRPSDPGKIKAESGIKAVLTLGGSRMSNIPVSSFAGTHSHHGTGKDESNGRGGFKRDYLLQKKNASDGVLAGPSHKGAPVPAGMDGYAEVANDEFNTVLIWDKRANDPTRKIKAKFLHFDSVRVKTGDRVNPGTILGGQGNKPNYQAYHVHLEASAKNQDQWIRTVGAMIAGGQLPSDSGNPDDPGTNPVSDDPFEAMDKAIRDISVGMGLAAAVKEGKVKDMTEFKELQDKLNAVASATTSTPIPPSPVAPAAPPKPAAPPVGAMAPRPAPQSPQVAVVGASGAGSSPVSIPSSKPNLTPVGMSDDSYASLDSTAMTFKPFTLWTA